MIAGRWKHNAYGLKVWWNSKWKFDPQLCLILFFDSASKEGLRMQSLWMPCNLVAVVKFAIL